MLLYEFYLYNYYYSNDNSEISIGFENNNYYDIIQNKKIIGREKKNYFLDFFKFIQKNNNLGYTIKSKLKDNLNNSFIIQLFIDIDLFEYRILNLKYEELIFFNYLFLNKNNYKLLEYIWKLNWNNFNNVEIIKQNKKIKVKLFEYQLKSLSKLIEIEKNNNYLLDTKRNFTELINLHKFKNYDIDIFTKKINSNNKLYYKIDGGILGDEMGLGKTITMLSLILLNNSLNYYLDPYIIENVKYFKTNCTLIICPSHLTKQWSNEILKVNNCLKQILILTKTNHEKYKLNDILNCDILITSFQFISNIMYYVNYCYNDKLIISYKITKGLLLNDNEINYRNNQINNINYNLDDKIIFERICWKRIIVDEGHEIFSINSYDNEKKYLKEFLNKIKANKKWYVSGTPFYNKESLVNILNYLNFSVNFKIENEIEYNLKIEDCIRYGLNENNISNSILKNNYIRNTQESIKNQLNIPSAIVENIFIEFCDFERNLYNSLKINCDELYLRQICCNIQICSNFSNTTNILNFNDVKKKIILENEAKITKFVSFA